MNVEYTCKYCKKEADKRWHDCDPWVLRDRIEALDTELAEFYKPVIKDHNITEIIPDDMPDWARQAMKEGRFFSVALNRIKSLEANENQVGLTTLRD